MHAGQTTDWKGELQEDNDRNVTQAHDTQMSELWTGTFETLYGDFRAYSEESLQDAGEEDIHQARVSARKLMTLLKVLDKEETTGLLPRIIKAQKRLGKVRDADVLIGALKKRRNEAEEAGDKGQAKLLKAFVKRYKQQREKLRVKLKRKLPKLLDSSLDEEWTSFRRSALTGLTEAVDMNGELSRLEEAFEVNRLQYEQKARDEGARSEASLKALHKLRIAAKELRYAAGSAGFALNDHYRSQRHRYKDIQERLGEINDIRVRLGLLTAAKPKKLGVKRSTAERVRSELEQELQTKLERLELFKLS